MSEQNLLSNLYQQFRTEDATLVQRVFELYLNDSMRGAYHQLKLGNGVQEVRFTPEMQSCEYASLDFIFQGYLRGKRGLLKHFKESELWDEQYSAAYKKRRKAFCSLFRILEVDGDMGCVYIEDTLDSKLSEYALYDQSMSAHPPPFEYIFIRFIPFGEHKGLDEEETYGMSSGFVLSFDESDIKKVKAMVSKLLRKSKLSSRDANLIYAYLHAGIKYAQKVQTQ